MDAVPFARRSSSGPVSRARSIVWCDGVLYPAARADRGPRVRMDVDVFGDRADVLRRHQAEGWLLLGMSWQPQIAEEKVNAADVEATFARMRELLAGSNSTSPIVHTAAARRFAWCRKPLPGLGVVFIHRLRPGSVTCIYIGSGPQDPGFARRLGFEYRNAADFLLQANRSPSADDERVTKLCEAVPVVGQPEPSSRPLRHRSTRKREVQLRDKHAQRADAPARRRPFAATAEADSHRALNCALSHLWPSARVSAHICGRELCHLVMCGLRTVCHLRLRKALIPRHLRLP